MPSTNATICRFQLRYFCPETEETGFDEASHRIGKKLFLGRKKNAYKSINCSANN